jgi:hypothetical protein
VGHFAKEKSAHEAALAQIAPMIVLGHSAAAASILPHHHRHLKQYQAPRPSATDARLFHRHRRTLQQRQQLHQRLCIPKCCRQDVVEEPTVRLAPSLILVQYWHQSPRVKAHAQLRPTHIALALKFLLFTRPISHASFTLLASILQPRLLSVTAGASE